MSTFLAEPQLVKIKGEDVFFRDPPFKELIKKCLPALQKLLPYLSSGNFDAQSVLLLLATDDAIDAVYAFFSACSGKPTEFFEDISTEEALASAEMLTKVIDFKRLQQAFSALVSRTPTTPQ